MTQPTHTTETKARRPKAPAKAKSTKVTTVKATRAAKADVTPNGATAPKSNSGHDPYLLPALPDGPFVIKPKEVERLEVSIMPDGAFFVRGTRERLAAFVEACEAEGVKLIIDHASMCG